MKLKKFPSHQECRCSAPDPAITRTQLLYEIGRSREKASGESVVQTPLVPIQIPQRGFQLLENISEIKFPAAFWFTKWNSFLLEHHEQQVNG